MRIIIPARGMQASLERDEVLLASPLFSPATGLGWTAFLQTGTGSFLGSAMNHCGTKRVVIWSRLTLIILPADSLNFPLFRESPGCHRRDKNTEDHGIPRKRS